ncbi:NAD(+)/NADH kinase [Streptomyces parvulus]|uniref:NAD(+)/NADH kinase n=1 Tax=Streptomyces parvulus TaxID=146923 RepID=UPI0037F70587
MTFHHVGLVVHGGRGEAVAAAQSVQAWCAERSVKCAEVDVWADSAGGSTRPEQGELHSAGGPDLYVTLGGDGTFLRGAQLAAESDALILGVDLGRVGFLTEVPARCVRAALEAVYDGTVEVESRMLLTLRASCPLEIPVDIEPLLNYSRTSPSRTSQLRLNCETSEDWGLALNLLALNDVVLEKLSRDRQVSVGVYLAGRLLASYSADALLVATPTGSTAYSFAAGGPVISPRAEGIVFTPVAAHMAFNRSVVTAPDEPVALRVLERSGQAAVSIDGQLRGVLNPGDWIGVYAAPYRLKAARLGPMDFYGRLRDRLRLTDAPAALADGTPAPLWPVSTPRPKDLAHLALPELPGEVQHRVDQAAGD